MKRNNRITIIELVFLASSIFLWLCSCSNDFPMEQDSNRYDKNIIVLVDGNNNLNGYSEQLVHDLNTLKFDTLRNNIILIYNAKKNIQIYNLTKKDSMILQKENIYESLQKYLEYFTTNIQAEEYGLILWSHGTGWINTKRSFGDDGGKSINIYELAQILPIKFDYVVFDACYMSCIENVFELREKTKYIIASPDKIPADGIIDSKTMKTLTQNGNIEDRLMSVCDNFKMKHANNNTNISLALLETTNIENVANQIKTITNKIRKSEFHNVNYYAFRNNIVFFDLDEVFLKTELKSENIEYKQFIKYAINGSHNVFKSSGVSIFLPTPSNSIYYNSYCKCSWNKYTSWLDKFY